MKGEREKKLKRDSNGGVRKLFRDCPVWFDRLIFLTRLEDNFCLILLYKVYLFIYLICFKVLICINLLVNINNSILHWYQFSLVIISPKFVLGFFILLLNYIQLREKSCVNYFD